MKNLLLPFVVFLLLSGSLNAQKFVTKNGFIQFYSHAPIEDITADNNQVSAALDGQSGEIVFKVLMKSFLFKKALMQEHFNENYIESDKYPNALFKGKITNIGEVNFSRDGVYNVTVEGDLTIHGVTKHVVEKGTLEIRDGKVNAHSIFNVLVEDYNISIPNTVVNNISKTIEVRVTASLEKLVK